MDSNNYAVIDLGSNTFHVLIFSFEEDPFRLLYRNREYVFLSEKGVKTIGDEAFHRGMNCLGEFHKTCESYNVSAVKIVGTETLRKASNGPQFLKEVNDRFGWSIELVSGQQEAALITEGIKLSGAHTQDTDLIMDIGGGSVEFVVIQNTEVLFSESFPIGLSILKNTFHHNEPMNVVEKEQMYNFVQKSLHSLLSFIKNKNIDSIIGASGSFEVLTSLTQSTTLNNHCVEVDLVYTATIIEDISGLNYDERLGYNGLPNSRAKHMVVALQLIKAVIDMVKPKRLIVSDFALKEGVIANWRNNI